MRSIKPGRGPSAMGAAGSIVAIVVGIFWTILAYSITRDAPFPMVGIVFPLFGVLFVVMGVVQAVIHFKNATGRNRMSLFDIVDTNEEPDPLDRSQRVRNIADRQTTEKTVTTETDGRADGYCPYCGTGLRTSYVYCPKCGKTLERTT